MTGNLAFLIVPAGPGAFDLNEWRTLERALSNKSLNYNIHVSIINVIIVFKALYIKVNPFVSSLFLFRY